MDNLPRYPAVSGGLFLSWVWAASLEAVPAERAGSVPGAVDLKRGCGCRQGLVRLLDEWEPSVYSVPTLVNAVRERLSYDAASVPLLRALARLYSFEGKHDLAIAIYLR